MTTATSQSDEVAKTIASEACGAGKIEMYAVANIILNRTHTNDFPPSPYEVVIQEGQFAGFSSPNKERLYLECKEYADYLSKNIFSLKDITNGALYFQRFGDMGHIYYKKTPHSN